MKRLIIPVLAIGLLAGCGEEKISSINNAEIVSKETGKGFKGYTTYFFTVKSGDTQIRVETTQYIYKAYSKGTKLDIKFDREDMTIKDYNITGGTK